MLLGLLFALRGTTYIYQGQEIGMTNGAFESLDEIMDIESHNVDKMAKSLGIINPFRWHLIKKTSRDNARTPMQWSAEDGAGFTKGTPWLKINPNYKTVNVEREESIEDGILSFFRSLTKLKKHSDILRDGSFTEVYAGKSVYAFSRELDGRKLLAVCNFSKKEVNSPVHISGDTVLSNYEKRSTEGKLRPYEFLLIGDSREK